MLDKYPFNFPVLLVAAWGNKVFPGRALSLLSTPQPRLIKSLRLLEKPYFPALICLLGAVNTECYQYFHLPREALGKKKNLSREVVINTIQAWE